MALKRCVLDRAELSLADVLGVRDHVAVVVISADVVGGKPHPEGFALTCSWLGMPAAGCVVLEDSPTGIAAAVAAGVEEVYGVSTTHPAQELAEAGAVEVYPDLSGIAARIGFIG